MVADVQGWLDGPGSNFGWIIKAVDESPGTANAKRFDSSESSAGQPALTVNYTIPEAGTALLVLLGLPALLVIRHRPERMAG
jgi:hypothetical protein